MWGYIANKKTPNHLFTVVRVLIPRRKRKAKIYREKLLDEFEKFFCGDESYEDERKKISESIEKTKQYIIGVLSSAIGTKMGVTRTFIAPVIALLIMSMGKMRVNAWCAMRVEIKANQQT
jgi:hypothetical protein